MGRMQRIIAATAVAASGGLVLAAPADAGEAPATEYLEVNLSYRGLNPVAVLDAITVEVWEDEIGGADVSNLCSRAYNNSYSPLGAESSDECPSVPVGDYVVGLDGLPAGVDYFVSCGGPQAERLPDAGAAFTLDGEGEMVCRVDIGTPLLAIDKIVEGGDATAADFEFEVYDDQGTLVDTPAITDPSDDVCTGALSECALVELPPAQYTLGEVLPSHGYEVGSVDCESFIGLEKYFGESEQIREMIDDEGAAFRTDDGDAYCTVTNVYREGQLIVTASVNNDDGGVAGVEDVSIEVYEADGDTPVIAATTCAADGSCLDEMLPIGDYVIGYIGPDGYTREITQSVSQMISEKVTDDADAAFTAAFGEVVEIEVVIDDPAPEPTTTTTQPATTTTAFDAGAGTLPPTGASSQTNTTIAVLALALIAAGLALIGVRRRTA